MEILSYKCKKRISRTKFYCKILLSFLINATFYAYYFLSSVNSNTILYTSNMIQQKLCYFGFIAYCHIVVIPVQHPVPTCILLLLITALLLNVTNVLNEP